MVLANQPTDQRRIAADRLGVPLDAPPADARAAFLRYLPAAGFVPDPDLCAAAAAFVDSPVPGAAPSEPNAGLRVAVEAFAKSFWLTPPAERRARWADLLGRASVDPLLVGRLRRLEAGVDLPDVSRDSGPPRPREVLGLIQALFVLGPIERAIRRRKSLDALPPPAAAWEQAARFVQHQHPAHAALDPALIDRLAAWTRRPKPDPLSGSRPPATWGFQAQGGLMMPRARPTPRRSARRGFSGVLVAIIVINLIRAAASLVSGPSTSPPRPQPTRVAPSLPRYSSPVAPKSGTPDSGRPPSPLEDLMRRMEDQQRQQASPPGGPP